MHFSTLNSVSRRSLWAKSGRTLDPSNPLRNWHPINSRQFSHLLYSRRQCTKPEGGTTSPTSAPICVDLRISSSPASRATPFPTTLLQVLQVSQTLPPKSPRPPVPKTKLHRLYNCPQHLCPSVFICGQFPPDRAPAAGFALNLSPPDPSPTVPPGASRGLAPVGAAIRVKPAPQSMNLGVGHHRRVGAPLTIGRVGPAHHDREKT